MAKTVLGPSCLPEWGITGVTDGGGCFTSLSSSDVLCYICVSETGCRRDHGDGLAQEPVQQQGEVEVLTALLPYPPP